MAALILDTLFNALSVDIEAFAICEVAEDVRLIFPAVDATEVHHVLEGTLFLSIDDGDPIEASAGSMLVVPPGHLQYLAASRTTATSRHSHEVCVPVRDGIVVLDATEGRPSALRLACGTVLENGDGSLGPLDGLSRHISENLADVPIVAAAFHAMLKEAAEPSEGTMALTSSLMKACLVVLLRRHLRSSQEAALLPAIFRDTRLSRAIADILDRPAADHSVAAMAKIAGMSRSAFSRYFKMTTELTPMEFVTRVRLEQARRLLLSTAHAVEAIATSVGFSSRSHFSRAFRAQYGTDPSNFRRRIG